MCNDSSSTTKTSSNTTQSQTPNVPSFISDPDQDYAGRISNLMATAGNGAEYVAPASALQTQGFTDASNLGSWQSTIQQALGQVNQATSTPTPTYTATGYAPSSYSATGYTPATITQGAQVATTPNAAAGSASATLLSSLLSGNNLGGYLNPATNQVVNTTLAGYDKQAGQDQATLAAQQALNGAFGGSGAAIGQANLLNSQELTRAQEQASLEQQAFTDASGLATTDANNSTGVSESNAASQTQASVANAQIAAQKALAQAGYDQGTLTANQDALNTAGQYGATASNAASEFGATAANAADQFGASADNTASQANQAALLQAIQTQLAGAQLTGSLGTAQQAGAVSDANTQLAAGATQRGIAADQATAPLTLAQTLQSLLGYNPAEFIGQTATGSSNSSSTTQTSPSLLQTLTALTGAYSSAGSGSLNFAKSFNPSAYGG